MSTALAIARRELGSYFRTPAGWVIVSLFLLLTGFVFAFSVMVPGSPASLRAFFATAGWLLLPVAPAITMRLLADEMRSGTIEALLTAPVGSASLVMGKFLGAAGFLAAMIAPTGVYVLVLSKFSSSPLDAGPILSGYLCLVLMGVLFLSVGTLASSLTQNSTLAFMVALFAILGVLLVPSAVPLAPDWARPVLNALSVGPRVTDFAKGVIDSGNIVALAAASIWMLVMATLVMESRRWR
ncbi:MAG: ABC transporter permease subunit [Phycisphaerales bacterium]|nr:ABC transporter permease subunit [Phycisphaerales bacterium]